MSKNSMDVPASASARPMGRAVARVLTEEECELTAGGLSALAKGSFTKVHRSIDVDYEDTD
ncbi:hypothetical protein [Sphingomonas sp. PB1R3]|uniref:hypothetical protein n=1 Tax=Sphingomonas flavida TaxID=3096154 RepID=UPI002FC8A048